MSKFTIDLPDTKALVTKFGLGENGYTQKFFSNELMRIADSYAPFDQGALKNSATIVDKGTAIEYRVPYARVHWFGKVMAGSMPRVATEKNMVYQGAPKRGPRWVERAFADNREFILKAVEEVAQEGKG